jgi:acetyl-CoA C-acetyltransferase
MLGLRNIAKKAASKATSRRSIHSSAPSKNKHDVVIVSAARTPVGSFGGSLASVSAVKLGSVAVSAAIERAGISPSDVGEILLGNVVSANLGQSPARQVQLAAGIPVSADTTTINKVCASGMKAVMYGAQSIILGAQDVVVAGGFESMSNIPYYVDGVRFGGLKFGDSKLIDGISRDGLSDAYDGTAMGVASDHCSRVHGVTRQQQDEYCVRSYKLAAESVSKGLFKPEIAPVVIASKKGNVSVEVDEEVSRVQYDKIPTLRAAFGADGTATAANSSKLNDGASALVLMSVEKAAKLGLKPLARIVSFADGAGKPIDFPVAPSISLPRAIASAGLRIEDIDFFEINEAFSSVPLANMKLLGIPLEKMNVRGGAVALGHPIGSSGSRILVTLSHLLQQTGKRYGAAAICNGGGGSSAVVIERL